jgi:PhzF family phenazine biosynthesis protein
MKTKIYQVDAFTEKLYGGNPAAVCPLDKWLDESIMQNIASENNLSETAFFVKEKDGLHIRWFTPAVEVDLCGHATLASAHVIFHHLKYKDDVIVFHSKSGELTVSRHDELIALNFPADKPQKTVAPNELIAGIEIVPLETYKGKTDYMLIYLSQKQIEIISPEFQVLEKAKARGVIVTAKGDETDFVSRFFAPQSGVNEDPVTGSSHTMLIPYWSNKLGKKELTAKQISKRQGLLWCKDLGDRVEIAGKAVTYLIGEIDV